MKLPFRKGGPVEPVPYEAVPDEALPSDATPAAPAGRDPVKVTGRKRTLAEPAVAAADVLSATSEPDSATSAHVAPAPDESQPAEVGDVAIRGPRLPALRALVARLRPGDKFERYAWLPVGVAIAAILVLVSVYSKTVQGTDQTLVLMGFDQDRAQLITALIIAAVAAAVVTLVFNRIGYATLLGVGSLAALFTQTFVAETQNALGSSGATGAFDPVGWSLTLLTLVVMGCIFSWAASVVAAAVRPGIIASAGAAVDIARTSQPRLRLARRPVAAVLVIVLLGVTFPAFGDMVNLTPDALMLQGNDQGGGLIHDASFPDQSALAQASATPSPSPSASASASAEATASPTPTPRITAAPGTKPWLEWKPSGSGHVETINLLAPWIGGTATTSQIDVYTPPGYGTGREYPVIYEAPTGLPLWGKGTGIISALDTMIDSGEIPASVVVFIDSANAPYGDTECADMYDGSQWFESYITNTVVNWVEAHYTVIHDPKARGIMGMSAGGFCAAMLALRHPDVFGISISFSGYYTSGAGGPGSAKPFGDQLEAHSPALLAPQLAIDDRNRLFFIIIVNPYQQFYGPHAANFEKILGSNGYKYLRIDSQYTHGWTQVRYETPPALQAWGTQLVLNGIW